MFDVVLVGGGLANALIAWRLVQTRPDVSFALVEAGPTLGGNHTWSFHGTDVTPQQLQWLWVLVSRSWPSHDVIFERFDRRIGGGYHSIRSEDLHHKVVEALGARVALRAKANSVTATRVTLASGETLEAKVVIDGRGFAQAPNWPCGYQKFLGLDVELDRPHGLEVPLLMDGRVAQHGAFRFLYLLPWNDRTVLVEDTSYADDAALDLPALRERIQAYLDARGLRVTRVLREEAAALPIPLSGAAPTLSLAASGVAAGLFHATTGYSLPFAVDFAEAFAQLPDLSFERVLPWVQARASSHWRQQRFFRLLNRMLFKAAEPEARVKIFESFYGHDDGLIGRFYAGRLTLRDMATVLTRGAGTVPTLSAVRASLQV